MSGQPGGPSLDVAVAEHDVATVIALVGELDLYSASALRDPFHEVISTGERAVLLDVTAVPFIDSAGLGQIVGLYKRLREQHRALHLVGVSSRVLRPLEVMGLDRVFTLDPDLESALAALGGPVDGGHA